MYIYQADIDGMFKIIAVDEGVRAWLSQEKERISEQSLKQDSVLSPLETVSQMKDIKV